MGRCWRAGPGDEEDAHSAVKLKIKMITERTKRPRRPKGKLFTNGTLGAFDEDFPVTAV